MDDLDDESWQRLLLLYRQAYITADVELLKKELMLFSNKKEELKNSIIDEIEAILKESGIFFSIFKEIIPRNPPFPSEIR